MKLISNITKTNHLSIIKDLIEASSKIIISSGWMKKDGLLELMPSFNKAIKNNGALITIFSNRPNHTQKSVINILNMHSEIKHVVVPKDNKTLHTKMYYFEKDDTFTVIVGSANITSGGLTGSEELSILIEDRKGSKFHKEIYQYINNLENLYGKCL